LSILYDDKGTNDCSYILLALSILYDDKGTNDCSYILLALSILYDDKGTNDCSYRRDDKKSYNEQLLPETFRNKESYSNSPVTAKSSEARV
jgi:hypothetical protein